MERFTRSLRLPGGMCLKDELLYAGSRKARIRLSSRLARKLGCVPRNSSSVAASCRTAMPIT
jgi:hypothetical protein